MIGKNFIFCSVAALLACAPACSSLAQSRPAGGISGYVFDAENQEPLVGANVFLAGTGWGAATNKSGYFAISHVPPGKYTLHVRFVGYRSRKMVVEILPGKFLSLRIALRPQPIELQDVEVSARYYREEEKNASTVAMPVARLRGLPAIGETDLLRALQLLPGIQAVNELSSGLYIRGGSPDQNLILLDDITVYNPSHFFGFFSTFNPDAIKDIRLIRGGFPAEYGGRLSAVLDITNRDGNRERFESRGAVSLISSKLLIEGPLPRGSFMISGRRTYLDLLLSLSREDNLPQYYFYDLNAKVNLDIGQGDRLIFSGYLGRDNLHFDRKEQNVTTGDINIGWGNRVFSAQWIHLFGPRLFARFVLAASRFQSLIDADASGFTVIFDNSIQDYSAKANLEWFASPQHYAKFGVWLTRYRFFNAIRIGENTGFENRIASRPIYLALFVQDEWRPSPRWKVLAGLRANAFSDGPHIQLDPRLQIRRQLTNRIGLLFSLGSYTQYTTVVVNDVASFADLWYPIDDTIDPQRSQHYIAGLDVELPWSFSLNVEAYYKPMQNVVEFRESHNPNRDKLKDIFYVGRGLSRGIEFFLQKRSGRLTGWIGYSWSRTTRTFVHLNAGKPFPAKWDFTHDLTITLSYRPASKWQLGATFVYKSGPTFTVPAGKYRLGPPGFPIDYIRAGPKNGARLEPYHRLDLFISRKFQLLGIRGSANLNIFNVYNHRNVWYRDYDFRELNEPPKVTDVRLLPILPTLEVTFAF